MSSQEVFNKLMNYQAGVNQTPTTPGLKPSERFLENLKNQGFKMESLMPILETQGNMLIISGAGAGKTTSMAIKALYDFLTGELITTRKVNGQTLKLPAKVWVSTFLKSGAEDIEKRFKKFQNETGLFDFASHVQFSTMHAEFKRALTQIGVATPIIQSKDNTKLLKEVINKLGIKNDHGNNLTSEEISNVESALAYSRNRLDQKRFIHDTYTEFSIYPVQVQEILENWKQKRRSKKVFDFEDLQEILYQSAVVEERQDVINFLRNRYQFIMIDEFQDTSQIQYELLKVYASGAKKIIAIGDDDQTIYSWRGSDHEVITKRFSADFNPTMQRIVTNYRCPAEVLNPIIPSISKNKNRFEKSLQSASAGGVLRYGAYETLNEMGLTLREVITQDVSQNRSVAVLVRINSGGILPALMLEDAQLDYALTDKTMTLDSYIGATALGIVRLVTEKRTQIVGRLLDSLTWHRHEVSALMQVLRSNPKLSIWNIAESDFSHSCPGLWAHIKVWRSWVAGMDEIELVKNLLRYYRDTIFKKKTDFNENISATIDAVLFLLEKNTYSDASVFLTQVEEMTVRMNERVNKKNTVIQLSTVHSFKGKEADSVYVWNDSEGVFPHEKNRTGDDLEEERRIHYIACTRARQISTILYRVGRKSRFVNEMNLTQAIDLNEGK